MRSTTTQTFSVVFLALLLAASAQSWGGFGGFGGRRGGPPMNFNSPSFLQPVAAAIFKSKACR
jgi:hypothetical protein